MKITLNVFVILLLVGCNNAELDGVHRIGETALLVTLPENVEVEETRPAEDFYMLNFSLHTKDILSMYVGNAPNLREENYRYEYSKNHLQHFCNGKTEYLDCYIKMGFVFPKYVHYQAFDSEHDLLVGQVVGSIQVNEDWLKDN